MILLARLGLDRSEPGRELDGDLLKDSLARFAAAADAIGRRAVAVPAKNRAAMQFYERYGFRRVPETQVGGYTLAEGPA